MRGAARHAATLRRRGVCATATPASRPAPQPNHTACTDLACFVCSADAATASLPFGPRPRPPASFHHHCATSQCCPCPMPHPPLPPLGRAVLRDGGERSVSMVKAGPCTHPGCASCPRPVAHIALHARKPICNLRHALCRSAADCAHLPVARAALVPVSRMNSAGT